MCNFCLLLLLLTIHKKTKIKMFFRKPSLHIMHEKTKLKLFLRKPRLHPMHKKTGINIFFNKPRYKNMSRKTKLKRDYCRWGGGRGGGNALRPGSREPRLAATEGSGASRRPRASRRLSRLLLLFHAVEVDGFCGGVRGAPPALPITPQPE